MVLASLGETDSAGHPERLLLPGRYIQLDAPSGALPAHRTHEMPDQIRCEHRVRGIDEQPDIVDTPRPGPQSVPCRGHRASIGIGPDDRFGLPLARDPVNDRQQTSYHARKVGRFFDGLILPHAVRNDTLLEFETRTPIKEVDAI
jgi:hypothetical protein